MQPHRGERGLRDNSNGNMVYENEVFDSTRAGIQTNESSGNLIKENQVLGNGPDLYDDSDPWPLDNTWVDNEYDTKNWVEP
ncbi:hypothetical protein ACFLV0_00220 [Chloroflexota bacterium]